MRQLIHSLLALLHFRKTIESITDQQTRQTTHMLHLLNSRMFSIEDYVHKVLLESKRSFLKEKCLYCQEKGITLEKYCNNEVIITLTTYKERLHEVHLTIESIMQGTVKPNRIILWLAENEYNTNDISIFLQKQMRRGLEIRYCKDLRSYKKIIPTLKMFPDACIVTIDDDLIYEPDILEHLLLSYRKYPSCVSACRTERIKTNDNGMPLEYSKWDRLSHTIEPSHYNFLTSGGGTLFPPHSLPPETQNEDVFMQLAPETDDVWLNAMLLLGKVKVAKAFTHDPEGSDYIANESPYVRTLWSENKLGRNDQQLQSVWTHYGLTLNN